MIQKGCIKLAIFLPFCTGLVFSLFSIIFYFGNWHRALVVFLFGFFFGALAIPEIEEKAVLYPTLFQIIAGILGGCMLAIALSASLKYAVGGAIIGAVLGFTAHYWIKFVQIP